jgi:uncharacterized lipoprotein NlpE involved in copper resistance
MKKKFPVLAAILVIFALGACKSKESEAVDAAHNSRNSINWDGVYTGIIPAADGPGIKVQLVLRSDETYELRYEYIDKPGVFTSKGDFRWDESGSVITLDDREMPPYYKVGENILIQLDMQGKIITGNLADNYVLRKNELVD